jgi:hypothetical protein
MFRYLTGVAGILLLSAAPSAAQTPSVVLAVHMPSTDLQVVDMKFRVMFNKREHKTIPLNDFDFSANLQGELADTLASDPRARWRAATASEIESLTPLFSPASLKAKSLPPVPAADRVLLVGAAYGAFIHAMRKFIEVDVAVRFVDGKTGKVLWKKRVRERSKLPDTLEDMQADNQKVLKETLNRLMDVLVPKVKTQLLAAKL